MDFVTLMVEGGVFIAAGLYVVGLMLKKTPIVPDWVIPWALAGLGIVAAGFSMEGGFTVENILQGLFACGAAVWGNQAYKQTTLREPGEKFMNLFGSNEDQIPIDTIIEPEDPKRE